VLSYLSLLPFINLSSMPNQEISTPFFFIERLAHVINEIHPACYPSQLSYILSKRRNIRGHNHIVIN
jgi:hypothetical protein